MITDSQRAYLQTVNRVLQIIVAAMAGGTVLFGVVAVVVDASRQVGGQQAGTLTTYMAIAMALMALVASIASAVLITSRARQNIVAGEPPIPDPRLPVPPDIGDVGPLAATYQTRLIVAAGMLEGAALFNLIAYLVETRAISLVAAAVLLLAILSLFPTRSRLEDWVENQLTVIAQLREMQSINAR